MRGLSHRIRWLAKVAPIVIVVVVVALFAVIQIFADKYLGRRGIPGAHGEYWHYNKPYG